MNEANPTPEVGAYVSTAPCAEVGLVAGETCQFGYVNLGRFHTGSSPVPVDLDALADTVRTLVRAPDDALDFLGQAWADARDGHAFREYGFTPISV